MSDGPSAGAGATAPSSSPVPPRPDVVIDLLARAGNRATLGTARLQPDTQHDQPLLGIVFCLLGIASFSCQDVLIKLMSGSYALWQLAFVRGVVVLAIMCPIVSLSRGISGFVTHRLALHAARGALAVTSYTCYYLAVANMPLVEAGALYSSAPLFVTLFSVVFLRETVGWRRSAAVCVGFVGVLIMLRPGAAVFEPIALLSIASAALYAYSTTVTRTLGRTESAAAMTVYSNTVYLLVSGLILLGVDLLGVRPDGSDPVKAFLLRPWVVPDLPELGLMVLAGVLATSGFFCLSKAYAVSPVSQVAPFEFSYLLWGLLLGLVIWGYVPSFTTIIGALVVVGAGVYIIKRESVLTGRTLRRGAKRRRVPRRTARRG